MPVQSQEGYVREWSDVQDLGQARKEEFKAVEVLNTKESSIPHDLRDG